MAAGRHASPSWRHQMGTFSALLAICAGNSPVTGEFHAQRPMTRYFDVFFDLRLNERLSKQPWGWWFETPSRPLWRHSNAYATYMPLGLQFTNVRSMTRCVQNPSRAFKSIISMSMSVLRNHQGQFCVSYTSLTCLNQYTSWLIEITGATPAKTHPAFAACG